MSEQQVLPVISFLHGVSYIPTLPCPLLPPLLWLTRNLLLCLQNKKPSPVLTESEKPILFNFLTSSSINSIKLNDTKFLHWSTAIKTFLISKDKLSYMEKDPKWVKEDAQVHDSGIPWSHRSVLMWFFFLLPMHCSHWSLIHGLLTISAGFMNSVKIFLKWRQALTQGLEVKWVTLES